MFSENGKSYGFSISIDEINDRKEDIQWFVRHTRPLSNLFQKDDRSKMFFVYPTKEACDSAVEIANMRYRTVSDTYEFSRPQ